MSYDGIHICHINAPPHKCTVFVVNIHIEMKYYYRSIRLHYIGFLIFRVPYQNVKNGTVLTKAPLTVSLPVRSSPSCIP